MKNLQDFINESHTIFYWLNDLPDQGIFITDANLNIFSWNHWLEIHSGLSAKQMIGRNLLEVYPQIIQRRLSRFYDQALSGQVIMLSQRLHGYLIPIASSIDNAISPYMLQSVRIAPLMNNSATIGTITLIEDVTERVARETELQHQIEALQQTESALLSTYTRLQHLLSSSPAIVYTRQLANYKVITFVSDNVTTQLGYQPEELIGFTNLWIDCVHPDDFPIICDKISNLFEHRHYVLEYRFLHKDGTYRWIRDEMKIAQSLSANVQEIVGTWSDITERKKAEEEVKKQAALLDIATDAIFVGNFNNQIIFWNKSAEQLYGWTRAEVREQKANYLFYEETSPQLEEARKTVLEKGEWLGELHQVNKEGNEVLVESRWTLVRDDREKPKAILIVNTNITHKKKLEAQLIRIQRIESLGTLAGGIAHDLNNLLMPIIMGADLLQKELPNPKKQQLLTLIKTSAERGANLIKQLLSFARGIERGRTLINIKYILWEIQQIILETFPKSIQFYTDIPQDMRLLYGDATQLYQVLLNICVNARDAMPKGGILKICAENITIEPEYVQMNPDSQVGSYILLTISDTGTGIPPEILDRIFEPFFTTKDIGKGTGIGLSTVVGIIKSHKGFLRVETQVGTGTKFKVYLPAID